jgi:hypothetical protein
MCREHSVFVIQSSSKLSKVTQETPCSVNIISWLYLVLCICQGCSLVCRLVGDLIYLDVITLEGNKYSITGSTKMFYVNSSSANTLDPRPSKATSEATTLVALLQKISPKFKKGS